MNGIADAGICLFVSERVCVRSHVVCVCVYARTLSVLLVFVRVRVDNTNVGVGQVS